MTKWCDVTENLIIKHAGFMPTTQKRSVNEFWMALDSNRYLSWTTTDKLKWKRQITHSYIMMSRIHPKQGLLQDSSYTESLKWTVIPNNVLA